MRLGWIRATSSSMYREGRPNRDSGDFEAAIANFNEALKRDRQNLEALTGRGLAYAGLGNSDRAIEDFDEVIRLDPDYADAYVGRGGVYREIGRIDLAEVDFAEAVSLDDSNAQSFFQMALGMSQVGDFGSAVKNFSEAIHIDPNFTDAYRLRGLAQLSMGFHQQAADDFGQTIRLNPDSPVPYYNLAQAYLAMCRAKSGHRGALERHRAGCRRPVDIQRQGARLRRAGAVQPSDRRLLRCDKARSGPCRRVQQPGRCSGQHRTVPAGHLRLRPGAGDRRRGRRDLLQPRARPGGPWRGNRCCRVLYRGGEHRRGAGGRICRACPRLHHLGA